MIKSAIRFIVHAMFGVGILTAFGLLDGADAAQRGPAKATVTAKTGAAQDLRSGSDVDAEPTAQSQTPRVLNRWDMNRRADASAEPASSLATEHERRPVASAFPAKGPVVVTIPTPSQAAVELAAPAEQATAMNATVLSDGMASNGVVCLAGCR